MFPTCSCHLDNVVFVDNVNLSKETQCVIRKPLREVIGLVPLDDDFLSMKQPVELMTATSLRVLF